LGTSRFVGFIKIRFDTFYVVIADDLQLAACDAVAVT